jgi:8-oxo-dGTP diphosphatase
MDPSLLHEVAITAIVTNEDKYLIVRRSAKKKRFPKMWTVPGGRLEASDYLALPKDTESYWYNVLERTLSREVKEEAGIEVDNVKYLTSLARVHEDGSPSIVISCTAEYVGGEVVVDGEENDQYAWVSIEQAQKYDLIDGIFQEFVQVERQKRGEAALWENTKDWPPKT